MSAEPLYLEDLTPGRTFTSGSVTVTADEIKAFARQYDPQPYHLDEAAAVDTFFGGLAASGWHVAALTMRLLVESVPVAGGIVGAGGEIAWPAPTRPGDLLTVTSEVREATPSRSRPDRGSAVLRSTTRNGAGQAVYVATMRLIVQRRGGTSDAA